MSIPGIGQTIAVYVIIATKGFTSFCNSGKFACYAGAAPFEYTSVHCQDSTYRIHIF